MQYLLHCLPSIDYTIPIYSIASSHDVIVLMQALMLLICNYRTRIQLEGLEDSHLLDDEDDTLRDKQGCPAYVSPEILERAQSGYSGKMSDQWSSGVMLYTMLIGRYPFQETDPTKLFEKIKRGHFSIPNYLSTKAKCLIRNLLRRDAYDRLTADETLQHPWLKITQSTYVVTNARVAANKAHDHLVPCSINEAHPKFALYSNA